MATTRGSWLAVLVAAALLASACVSTSPAPPPETRDAATGELALEGARYESMRVLAGRLAERAARTRDDAAAERSPRAGEEGLSRLSDLTDRARELHRRLDNYSDPPRYVRSEVRALDALVREVDSAARFARLSDRVQRSWRDVLDAMDRMNRLASGEQVDMPSDGSSTRDEPVFPASPTPSGEDTWRSGSSLRDRDLEEFRRASRELAVRSTLALEAAERTGGSSEPERRLLRDLQDFRARARDLERQSDATTLDRGQTRTAVDRLHDEARRVDRELRDGGLYPRVWSDWTEVLLLVRRMSDLVRAAPVR